MSQPRQSPVPESDSRLRRDELGRTVAERRLDLAGWASEMATRDDFRTDVLQRATAALQPDVHLMPRTETAA